MSLLTPVKVPTKVYRWDDAGAPALTKATNALATIWKACLVTGYGTGKDAKAGAGWTMPFEDATAGIKVFRPEIGAERDFYLRCSANTPMQMTAQVYLNMTDINTGELKLQCAQPFKFARGTVSNPIRWVLIASPRGFWFFNEQGFVLDTELDKSGAWFFCGDTMRNNIGERAVFLQHTGGTYNDGDYRDILGYGRSGKVDKIRESYINGKLLNKLDAVHEADPESFFSGSVVRTSDRVLSPLVVIVGAEMYQLPGFCAVSDGFKDLNFTSTAMDMGGYASAALVVSTNPSLATNFCVATEYWSY